MTDQEFSCVNAACRSLGEHHQLCLFRPAPAEVAQREAVEVVGYRWKYHIPKEIQGSSWSFAYASHWSTGPKDAEPLMTVAQHNRIVAAMAAQPDAKLVELLRDARKYIAPGAVQLRIDAKLASL
jgi:hypothetical protein